METQNKNLKSLIPSERYESPSAVMVTMDNEGILCFSGEHVEDYGQEIFPWGE